MNLDDSEDLLRRSRALDGLHKVSLADLLPDAFVRGVSAFATLQVMLDAGGIKTNTDLDAPAWDAFIADHTEFSSWAGMRQAAAEAWADRKMGITQ